MTTGLVSSLKIGDAVLAATAGGQLAFERIFAFNDINENVQGRFVNLDVQAEGFSRTLQLTPNHFIVAQHAATSGSRQPFRQATFSVQLRCMLETLFGLQLTARAAMLVQHMLSVSEAAMRRASIPHKSAVALLLSMALWQLPLLLLCTADLCGRLQ